MPLVPDPKNCDISVKRAIQRLSKKLGYTGSPTFANTYITNVITASTSVFSKTCEIAAGLNVLRVTGLQTDDTALTGTLRGAYIDVSNGSTEATGTIRALELKARTEAPNDTGSKVNVLEGLSISADSKARDVTTMRAAEFILDGKTAGTIDEAVGLRIANNLQVDKATLSYGLQIYRDSFNYTYDIVLSLGGHITGDSYVNQDLRTTATPTFDDLTISTPVNIYALSHNSFADYDANKHIDHTGVSITAGKGLSGGGTIASTRDIALDLTEMTGNVVWDDGATDASITWTYALSGASDPVWTIGANSMDLTTGVLKVGGTTVMLVGGAPTAHSIASHDDTTGTGAELNTLTDGSDAGALHSHAATYQPLDAVLTDIAALDVVADNEFIVGTDAGVYAHESGATARTSIGLGTTNTPQFAKLTVQDTTIETTIGYVGFYNDHRKTAGVTDHSDYFYGHQNYIVYNQTGGIIGVSYAFYSQFSLVDGDIGDASNSKNLNGVYSFVDLNAGKVYGNVFGFQTVIDQEAANEVTVNIYGNYIDIDADGTVGGSVYGLYLNEGSNVDYGIYQNGTAVNYFGGNIIINSIATPSESQFEITANGLGNISFLNYTADNCGIFFDAHYDSGMKSDDASSNFGIRKLTDKLKIIYDSAVAVGGVITWNDGFVMASDGGIFMHNLKSGTDQANAGAAADELYHDTDDNTIKIGL